MNYLHYEHYLERGDVVEVTLDGRANVLLMDGPNFESYKMGKQYRYYGGQAKVSPVRLIPPSSGGWHVVVDLGGHPGTIKAAVSVIKSRVGAS